jgi:hypothetical protein
MAGASIPAGLFGSQGFTGSNVGFGGNPNTTAAVASASDPSKLTAYDPTTMAATTGPKPAAAPSLAIAGMSSMGLPSWQTNWLMSGGSGTLSAPEAGVTGANQQSTPGTLYRPPAPIRTPVPAAGGSSSTTGTGTGTTTPTTPATPATAGGPYTLIPMNAAGGYNPPGIQQTLGVGGQVSGPSIYSQGIFSDGKGGYFAKDPAGKMVPLTGNSLAAAIRVLDPMGYGYGTKRAPDSMVMR